MVEIVSITLPYFALILCGFVARGMKIMGEGSPRVLNAFVLYFALPALLIRSLGAVPLAEVLNPGFLAAWGAVSLPLFVGVAVASRYLFRQPGQAAAIHAMTAAHGNIGYLGFTLIISLMGPAAVAPVAMAVIWDMFIVVTASIVLIEYAGAGVGGARAAAKALRGAVTNPLMMGIAGGLFFAVTGWALPGPVDSFLEILGLSAVPAALFAIGVTLYGQPLRAAVGEIGALCLLKLVIHPIAMLFVATSAIFGLSRDEIAVAVLLAAVPVANNVFVFATRYDLRPGRVSTAIFASTILALLTFNFWAWLLAAPAGQ